MVSQQRLEQAKSEFLKVFGRPAESACRVPYSVLLSGDGAEISLATGEEGLFLIAKGERGIRFVARGFEGITATDPKLPGPYANESEGVAGVIRGMEAAFTRRGHKTPALCIYADCPTLPGQGLDEPGHLAVSLAFIFNKTANGGLLSEKWLAEAVQWTMANYMLLDSCATDTYSSIEGKSLAGNFENPDSPVITRITPDFAGVRLFTVSLGQTGVDMPEAEVDPRLDSLIKSLGKEPEEMGEGEFYARLARLQDPDREAALFLMDYYTQENFETLYSQNAPAGAGSPSLGQTVDFKAEKSGVENALPQNPSWKQLCCVSRRAEESFALAMEKLFGRGCIEPLDLAKEGAGWIF